MVEGLEMLGGSLGAGIFGGMLGGLAVLGIFALVLLGIALYIYTSLALMTIAKRTKTKPEWLAWIPFVNLYLVTKIGKVSPLTLLALFAYLIPAVGGLIFAGFTAFWWWKVSEARRKPGWWGILMIIPVANLIIMGMLAWGKK